MENKMDTLEDLVRIIRILRGENGCPWDRVQTHASIRMDMLEEAYEAADAIDKKDMKNLCEELGDVLMQVVFHAEIETEQGGFTMGDVIQGICEKMIYRHPHVFGSGKADTAEEVLINWEELKKKEKRQETQTEVMQSVPISRATGCRACRRHCLRLSVQGRCRRRRRMSDLTFR